MIQQSFAAARLLFDGVDDSYLRSAAALTALTMVAAVGPANALTASLSQLSLPSEAVATAPAPAPAAVQPTPPPALIAFGEPAPGYPVISPFGLRQLPWEEGGRLHAGVDIAAPRGTPVLAAADGVVLRTGVDGGYGRFIEVRHAEGLTTRYGHLDAFDPAAQPGAAVKQGQAIGKMGSTGSSTGAHVHFEVRDRAGRPLNPSMFLDHSFAKAADLPLKAASRFPRGVRVAYVSFIPAAKRELMEEREAEKAAAAREAVEARIEAQMAKAARRNAVLIAQAQMTVISAPAAPASSPAPAAQATASSAPAAAATVARPTRPAASGTVSGRVHTVIQTSEASSSPTAATGQT